MKKPQGIGGWLLIPTLIFILNVILWTFDIFILPIMSDFTPADIVKFVIVLSFVPLLVYTLILEFKKKKEFKKWAMIVLWTSLIVQIILSTFTREYFRIYFGIVSPIIWTLYFIKSKRVENTFTQ